METLSHKIGVTSSTAMSFWLFICLCFIYWPYSSSSFSSSSSSSSYIRPLVDADPLKIHVEGKWFVDALGRKRIFHGVNAVEKGPPWIPAQMLQNSTRIKQMAQWGFNAVRLGMMWSGVEPEEGKINVTYLQEMKSIVSELSSHGIYVILDMHQDVISSRYGHYDGVPRWLIDSLPPPKHAFPWPFEHRPSPWAMGYLTEAVGNAFQQFYTLPSSRARFSSFWRVVASAFKSFPSLLGYELINEPWAGDIFGNPALLLPGYAGRRNLAPLYEVVSAAIRRVDDDSIVFFEPVTWGVVQPGTGVAGSGFDQVPGGEDYRNRTALSYHYYCWILGDDEKEFPYPPIEKAVCNDVIGKRVFQSVNDDQRRIGGGTFLTEFGNCIPINSTNECEQAEQFVLEQADANLQSWTYWASQFWNSSASGAILPTPVMTFARPFARAIAGTPTEMSFVPASRRFKLSFDADVLPKNDVIDAPTEVFLPRVQYPKGVGWEASPHLEVQYDAGASLALVRIRPAFKETWKMMMRKTAFMSSASASSSSSAPRSVPSNIEFFPKL